MNINRENYEMYFLDYHEGRLDPGQVAGLLIFLEAHPELKEEFEDFENILVAPDLSISYTEKNSLKKNKVNGSGLINASNYETYFIADTEKQLTLKEQQWLAGFLESNPELAKTHKLYLNTRLQPDLLIEYPKKAGLKRTVLNTRRFYYYAISAAASFAMLFAVYMNSGNNREYIRTAQLKPSEIPASGNHKKNRVIPKQHISTSGAKPDIKTAVIPADAHQSEDQSLAYLEQRSAEKRSVTEIRPRLQVSITSRNIVEPEYIFIRQSRNTPDLYTNIYDQVNLAERMQNEQLLTQVETSPKSILNSGLQKLGINITGREVPANHNAFNFWALAGLGINGYNLLADKDLKLLTQSNDSGKVVSYALKGDEFEFIRQKDKPKNP